MKNKLFLFAVLLGLGMAFSLTACKGDCNEETCINGSCDPDDKDQCICNEGWEGDACDTYALDKFIGTYFVTHVLYDGDSVGPGGGGYEDTLKVIMGEEIKFQFSNFQNYEYFEPICTLEEGYKSFSFPETYLGNTIYTAQGIGVIDENGVIVIELEGINGSGNPYTRQTRYDPI